MAKKKNSILSELFKLEDVEERRQALYNTPIEDILRAEMEEVGLFVFDSSLDYVDSQQFTGSISVAVDGMPERAKSAVEEVLRAQGIKEYYWTEYFIPGQVKVVWEVLDEDLAEDSH